MANLRMLVALLGLAFLSSVPTLGQGVSVDLGPRLGVDVADVDELFLGADVRLGFPSLPVVVNPVFDYYFTDGYDFYQFSANALLDMSTSAMPNISPYLGAGLGISNLSYDVDSPGRGGDNTDIGINLIGGGSIDAGSFRPFAQVQITLLGDVDLITISLGALFRVSG